MQRNVGIASGYLGLATAVLVLGLAGTVSGQPITEAVKLLASDGAAGDGFGLNAPIDGDYMVVSAHKDDDSGSNSGAVYVFHWDGSQWVEETKLTASDAAAEDNFGNFVDISGNRIAVAATYDDDKGPNSGSIYVFELPGPVEVSAPQVTATYNQALTVPIAIDAIDGVVSAEVFLEYDTDLLTLVGIDIGGTLSDGWSVETNTEAGTGSLELLKIAMATDENAATGGGTLVEVDFTVNDVRSPMFSPLTLTHVLLNDGTPESAATDGSVTLVGVDGTIASVPEEIIPRWNIEVTVGCC